MVNNLEKTAEYKRLIDNIIEISKTSTTKNSIIYKFNLDGDRVKSTISVMSYDGNNTVYKDSDMKIDNKFYNFVTPLIKEFISCNDIAYTDFVDLNEDNVITFRLITKNNDIFSIDGLTFADVEYLRDLTRDLKIEDHGNSSDSQGFIVPVFVVTVGILIGLVLACAYYLV